jgi:putative transposase
MSRIARVVAVGLPHHVTQRGNNRDQVFFSDDDRRFYLQALGKYAQAYGVEVWAYCLMDDHVHVLGVPESKESLARCFGGVNLVYTQYVNREQGRSGRLWQNRFFSCPVDKDAYLWPVLRYIERNPVQAGLARLPWEYQWSSARHHVLGEPDPTVVGPDWLREEMRKTDYRSYVQRESRPSVTTAIRRMTVTGRPLGNAKFTALLESKLGRELIACKRGRPRRTGKIGSVPN